MPDMNCPVKGSDYLESINKNREQINFLTVFCCKQLTGNNLWLKSCPMLSKLALHTSFLTATCSSNDRGTAAQPHFQHPNTKFWSHTSPKMGRFHSKVPARIRPCHRAFWRTKLILFSRSLTASYIFPSCSPSPISQPAQTLPSVDHTSTGAKANPDTPKILAKIWPQTMQSGADNRQWLFATIATAHKRLMSDSAVCSKTFFRCPRLQFSHKSPNTSVNDYNG